MSGLVVEGKTFALQDSIFVVTSRSSVNSGFAAFANQLEVQPFAIKITVAVGFPLLSPHSNGSGRLTVCFQGSKSFVALLADCHVRLPSPPARQFGPSNGPLYNASA